MSREKEETKGNDKSESKKACPGLSVGAIIECAFDDEEKGIQWLSSTGLLIFLHSLKNLVILKRAASNSAPNLLLVVIHVAQLQSVF